VTDIDKLSLDGLIALVGAERFDRACACALDPAHHPCWVRPWTPAAQRHPRALPEDVAAVLHECATRVWHLAPGEAIDDAQIPERIELALELYRRMPGYPTSMYMVTFVERLEAQDRTRFWADFRALLEDPNDCVADAVAYTLAVDYFLGPIADDAWSETTRLPDPSHKRPRARERGTLDAIRRRVTRVLEAAGPVPWSMKEPLLQRLVDELEWHPAVFRCLHASAFEVDGDIDRAEAHRLFARLRLPATTEDLRRLARALSIPPPP
jgi:hypothetical protein